MHSNPIQHMIPSFSRSMSTFSFILFLDSISELTLIFCFLILPPPCVVCVFFLASCAFIKRVFFFLLQFSCGLYAKWNGMEIQTNDSTLKRKKICYHFFRVGLIILQAGMSKCISSFRIQSTHTDCYTKKRKVIEILLLQFFLLEKKC